MLKRILITTAIGFALVCAGWAGGGWGANDEPGGGGGFYRVCDPVTHIQWEWSHGWWKPVGQC